MPTAKRPRITRFFMGRPDCPARKSGFRTTPGLRSTGRGLDLMATISTPGLSALASSRLPLPPMSTGRITSPPMLLYAEFCNIPYFFWERIMVLNIWNHTGLKSSPFFQEAFDISAESIRPSGLFGVVE